MKIVYAVQWSAHWLSVVQFRAIGLAGAEGQLMGWSAAETLESRVRQGATQNSREYNHGMITRRETLAGAVALLFELGEAHAQTQNQTTRERGQAGRGPVFKHDLPNLTMDDWEVTVSYVDYAPGRVGQTHHHAGFVLAYVLKGAIVTKISGQEERTYRTGEMFFEPPGSTHEVSNNASATEPAKLLAMIFAKRGVQLTTPGPA